MIYWLIFLILDGSADAFLYNIRDYNKRNKVNEHSVMWLRRAIVAFALFGFDIHSQMCAFLVSFYAHDLPYHLTRHLLDSRVYPDWYWPKVTGSTAWTDKFMNNTIKAASFQIGLFIYNLEYAIVAGILTLFIFGIGIRNTIKNRWK